MEFLVFELKGLKLIIAPQSRRPLFINAPIKFGPVMCTMGLLFKIRIGAYGSVLADWRNSCEDEHDDFLNYPKWESHFTVKGACGQSFRFYVALTNVQIFCTY